MPGADDNYGNMDGLKLYRAGASGYTLPFAGTSLKGINTSVYAASDRGGANLGKKDGVFCVVGEREIPIKTDGFSEAYFCPNPEHIVFVSFPISS